MHTEQVLVEWHFTPRGWVRGNWSTNKPLEVKVSPPPDRIETWVRIEITPEFLNDSNTEGMVPYMGFS